MSLAVVDASVALKWFFPEEGSAEARNLASQDLHAPDLLLVESANVLWRKVRVGDVTPSFARQACRALSGSPVTLHPTTPELTLHALELAVQLDHSIYDCLYLALALDLGAEALITADDRFLRAAQACSAEWSQVVQPLVQE